MTDVRLLSPEWVETLSRFDRLQVGFSGGLDSAVLLDALAREPALAGRIHAMHIHHGISPHADDWVSHCETFCSRRSVPLEVSRVKLSGNGHLEEQARNLRHAVFRARTGPTDCLLLAHHENDQAETLLFRMIRGSGVEGLAGMAALQHYGAGMLARPLLEHNRVTLEVCAKARGIAYVEDDSNQNTRFSRNFLRHTILPRLEAHRHGAVANLARASQHFQAASHNLEALALLDCPELAEGEHTLPTARLASLSPTRQDNVLRTWIRRQGVQMPSAAVFRRIAAEVLTARGDRVPAVTWKAASVRRFDNRLWLVEPSREGLMQTLVWPGFPGRLDLGGGAWLEALPSESGFCLPRGAALEVRFRKGGEVLQWHGQHKKLKKCLQEWGVPPWERDRIPLLFVDGELVVVTGHAVSDGFHGRGWQLHATGISSVLPQRK